MDEVAAPYGVVSSKGWKMSRVCLLMCIYVAKCYSHRRFCLFSCSLLILSATFIDYNLFSMDSWYDVTNTNTIQWIHVYLFYCISQMIFPVGMMCCLYWRDLKRISCSHTNNDRTQLSDPCSNAFHLTANVCVMPCIKDLIMPVFPLRCDCDVLQWRC